MLVAGGRYRTKDILTVVNINNPTETTPLDFWPNDGFDDDNINVKQFVYRSNARLFKNKSLNKYLYVCAEGKYVELFNIVDNKITNRNAICELYPKYKAREDRLNYQILGNNNPNRGFSASVSNKYIYLMPYNEYNDNKEGYPWYYKNIMDVFDWDGNFIKRYKLDVPCTVFFIDGENDQLYTITEDMNTEESMLLRYNLN